MVILLTAGALAPLDCPVSCQCRQIALGDVEDGRSLLEEVQEFWVCDPVKNILPIPAGCQHPGIPHHHQMLGYICLAFLEQGFQVTHASFPVSDAEQELDPDGGPEDFEIFRDLFIWGGG